MQLPDDPFMLLSAINMMLRDTYPSLDELCKAEGVDRLSLCQRLASAGFEYSEANNKFW
jgi:hypothetical protein